MTNNSRTNECDDIYDIASGVQELETPTNHELLDAADNFYHAANCYDRNGDRKMAAKCYTLAGEFYMSIADSNN